MSEKLIPRHTPYTAQELIDTGWVERVRLAIVTNGNAVRIGDHAIEAQCINAPDTWMAIQLPNGGTKLTTLVECAAVLDMLTGVLPIPPATPAAP